MSSRSCRNREVSQEEQATVVELPTRTRQQAKRSLEKLIELGLVIRFTDEYGVTRYRAVRPEELP